MGYGLNGNRRRTVGAIALIALGFIFWLGIGSLWPLFVLVPGIAFLAAAVAGGRATAAFAIPGMLISGTGALLLVQNVTGYWESWSYAWTLYGVFLGLGFTMMGRLLDDRAFETLGRVFVLIGAIAFFTFGFLMELVINVGGLGGSLWPVLLIALGLFLLARPTSLRRSFTVKRKNEDKLFTGPVVYGSRKRDASRLSVSEPDDQRAGRL